MSLPGLLYVSCYMVWGPYGIGNYVDGVGSHNISLVGESGRTERYLKQGRISAALVPG